MALRIRTGWLLLGMILVSVVMGCNHTDEYEEPPADAGPYPGECEFEWISDCDGDVDSRDYYTYDDINNLIFIDEGMMCTAFTYDESNFLVGSAKYLDCDMEYDSRCKSYEYDENGRMIGYQEDYSCDGSYIRCYYLVYGENDRIEEMHRSDDCSEVIDYCEAYTYDAQGSVIAEDAWCDGTEDTLFAFTYDDTGNPLTGSRDDNCDGEPNVCWNLTYDCWAWDEGWLFVD